MGYPYMVLIWCYLSFANAYIEVCKKKQTLPSGQTPKPSENSTKSGMPEFGEELAYNGWVTHLWGYYHPTGLANARECLYRMSKLAAKKTDFHVLQEVAHCILHCLMS